MKLIFGFFALLYMLFPLIVIPIFAYFEGNWYLLFGILFSYFASYTAVSGQLKSFIYLFLLLCIGSWLKTGFSFYQYITFFFFCSLGGFLFAAIADAYDSQIKREVNGVNEGKIEK